MSYVLFLRIFCRMRSALLYRDAKENMKEYQTAKYNIDHLLKLEEEEQQHKKNREQSL